MKNEEDEEKEKENEIIIQIDEDYENFIDLDREIFCGGLEKYGNFFTVKDATYNETDKLVSYHVICKSEQEREKKCMKLKISKSSTKSLRRHLVIIMLLKIEKNLNLGIFNFFIEIASPSRLCGTKKIRNKREK